MMRRQTIFALLVLLGLPCGSWAADGQASTPGDQAPGVFDDIRVFMNADPETLDPYYGRQAEVRFGWWGAWVSGSKAKVGEWQSWDSRSPFIDVDTMMSDGDRTLDFTATNTDSETTSARALYYQGGFKADVEYQRFIHELDHDPLNNINSVTNATRTANNNDPDLYRVFKSDLGSGQDYAVRVQELKANVKVASGNDWKLRVDVWDQQKEGIRQVNAIGMCYNRSNVTGVNVPPDHYGPNFTQLGTMTGNRCHLLSQPQAINWTTTEIKPVLEWRAADNLTFEYARPMRIFRQADQQTGRFYDGTGNLTYNNATNPNAELVGVVPNNFLEQDELKVHAQIDDENHVYGYFMAGENTSQDYTTNPVTGAQSFSVDLPRYYNDCDLRWTNKSIENVTVTTYAKVYNNYQAPANQYAVAAGTNSTAANGGVASLAGNPTSLSATQFNVLQNQWLTQNSNESTFTTGIHGVWRPFGGGYSRGGLAIVSGYEYNNVDRQLADYNTNSFGATGVPAPDLTQYNTVTHSFQVGPDMRWSEYLDTYLRYKFQVAQSPLVGIQGFNTVVNSLLPTTDHIIELGGTLMPSDHFMVSVSIGFEYDENHELVNASNPNAAVTPTYSNKQISFDETNYPFSINAWYGVSRDFSISGGFSETSNFVAQNVFAADQNSASTPTLNGRWSYGGRADIFNLGAQYRASEKIRYTAEGDYIFGHDLISNSNYTNLVAGASTADIGGYSEVLNRTTKVSLGVDYLWHPRTVLYVRYELYDFFEGQPSYPSTITGILANQTGTAQGILGGISASF